jgi:hypothetical protein
MPSGWRLPDRLAGLITGRGDVDAGQWRWYIKQATSSQLTEISFVERFPNRSET